MFKLLISFFFLTIMISADSPVDWKFSTSKKTVKVGDIVELKFDAVIKKDWYLYASEMAVEGPMPTSIKFNSNAAFTLEGKLNSHNPKEKHDEIWEGKIKYFEKKAAFSHKVKILQNIASISGVIEGQTCSNVNGTCVPFKQSFDIKIPQ